jgi:hypothetical protein
LIKKKGSKDKRKERRGREGEGENKKRNGHSSVQMEEVNNIHHPYLLKN